MFQYHEGRSQSLNQNEIIWNNSYIKINVSSFFYKKWQQQGICKISHLMDAHEIFLSFQAFQLKYSQLKCNFLEYFSVITAIKNSKGFLNSPLKNAISFILKQEKICKSVYPYILKRSAEFPLKSTNKWQNMFPSKTFQCHQYLLLPPRLHCTQNYKTSSSNFYTILYTLTQNCLK